MLEGLGFLERESVHAWCGEGERERGTENSKQAHAQHRAQCRARSYDPEIMTCAEIKSLTLS